MTDQYNQIIQACKKVFEKKNKDYGSSWRIMRLPSITDQIFIKAKRIRSIQERGTQKIEEGVQNEFVAIINYCIIALIQMELTDETTLDMPYDQLSHLYDEHHKNIKELLERKNHDYGEAWRDMRISSIVDLILTKILRIKQIEDNNGHTLISEGVAGNYQDIVNYAVFCLIKMNFTA